MGPPQMEEMDPPLQRKAKEHNALETGLEFGGKLAPHATTFLGGLIIAHKIKTPLN